MLLFTTKRQENRSTGSRSTVMAPCFYVIDPRRVSYKRRGFDASFPSRPLVIKGSDRLAKTNFGPDTCDRLRVPCSCVSDSSDDPG